VFKQVLVVRTDLKLGKGKLAAQTAHASVEAYRKASEEEKKKWLEENQRKIVLKVRTERELIDIYEKAKRSGLPAVLIRDAGLTQIPPGTKTAVGIGPADEKKIDIITGELPLL
jgi:PTH2 family peptidyl-tRNA hydrolase